MSMDGMFQNDTLSRLLESPSSGMNNYVRKEYAHGSIIFDGETNASKIMFLRQGWVVTAKYLSSGTRIVTDFMLSGDMLSTRAAELAQETVQALTDVVCYEFSDLRDSATSGFNAKLSNAVFLEMIRRQARMAERLANIGRRDGLERIGHLLLELAYRARHMPKPNLDGYSCPLRQADIGDAVGLSTVHVNRVLKDMRLSGLLWVRNGVVEFPDRDRLSDLVGFDAGYLLETGHFEQQSR